MNKEDAVIFLFTIAKELQRSFENPVILLTMNDYADGIFNCLVDMRTALLQNAKPIRLAEIVNTFHLDWLHAVQDIDQFRRRAKDTPRETILKAVEFTKESMQKRHKHFQKFIQHVKTTMTAPEKALMQTNIGILRDLEELVNCALVEKQKCLNSSADKKEFHAIIVYEIEELLNWLDSLHNYLAVQFCKVLDVKFPQLSYNLTKTLQEVIDEVANYGTPEAKKIAELLSQKDRALGSMARVASTYNDFEISKVVEKIKKLEDRIFVMKQKRSSAGMMALQHKTLFMEDRLKSLENLKLSLKFLKNQKTTEEHGDKSTKIGVHIFNHLLPHQQRCHLVEKLDKHWKTAIGEPDPKSLISILSSAEIQEAFSDETGRFTVDTYGRKIYTVGDGSEVYQLNQSNELVSVRDDDRHVYFYDALGRYYLGNNRERVYKAHDNASEYFLSRFGTMLKISEVEDGVQYRYDNLGRYYINDDGYRIYRERDSIEEFCSDGLGNLVKIRDEDRHFVVCPIEPTDTEESKYLKETVGAALKTCLAQIVMIQPNDPIDCLADMLEKYRRNIEAKQMRSIDGQELKTERERINQIVLPPISDQSEYEESASDYNFISYESKIGT